MILQCKSFEARAARTSAWKLNVFAFVMICFLTSLGFWQLSRAQEKKLILQAYAQRGEQPPLSANDLAQKKDYRFYQVQLKGRFANEYTLLLDNKIFHGQVGYEVYTPFKAQGISSYILVDRGFVPLGPTRQKLPTIKALEGDVTIQGLMNLPPAYFAFGGMQDEQNGKLLQSGAAASRSILRVEYINLKEIAELTHLPFLSHIINLKADHPAAYDIQWEIIIMPPERHQAYALQWFALALTLLILFVVLNLKRMKKS